MPRKPTVNRRLKLLRNRSDRLAALPPIHTAMRLRITDNPRAASALDGIRKDAPGRLRVARMSAAAR